MRRRRLLAMGAAAVGFAGCTQNDPAGTTSTSTRDGAGTPVATATEAADGPTTHIGGSVHGRPFRLGDDLGLIDRSDASWIHAFLDVRRKYDLDVDPRDDPDVLALRRAAREKGVNLFVSLQWNFVGIFGEQSAVSLPAGGSSREQALIEYATELLEAIDEPVDIVGLGNEPVWETPDEDFMGRHSPLIDFTRRLKDHLVEHYSAGDPRLVVGAFNRLYNEYLWREHRAFYRQLYRLAQTDDDIDGIDLHVHYWSLGQAEEMLEMARQAFPEGLVTATEFSPMWRYDNHKDTPISEFDGGEEFADRHGVDGDTTVRAYFEAAKYDRLSPEEAADFMETMPWYNVDFVEDMHDLLAEYDVEVGTFGFLVEDDIEQLDWIEEWAPFPINCLFQPALIDTEDGAHPHYLDDFRRLAGRSAGATESGGS